jgi:5-methylcytosine-specific restriction endonuclease McrA
MSLATILTEPVLILNVNHEPLHVCTTRRALALVFQGKAEIVLNGRGKIHSAADEFDIPSIIKLGYMVKRPRLHVSLTKREILRRVDFSCQYCGQSMAYLTVDHVVPRRLGGQHVWTNVVAACPACNRRKGGKTPTQAHMQLKQPPREPSDSAYYRFSRHLNGHDEWEPYIKGW